MSNVSEVTSAPLRKKIQALEQSNQELRRRLEDSKSKLDVEKLNLQAKYEVANRQLSALLKKEEKTKEYVAEVKQAVTALDPIEPVAILEPKESHTPMTAVFHLTDWHVGERIRAKETEGFGNFDWEVAQDRVLGQLVPGYLRWLNTQRSGYVINDACLLLTGDFISGDIHDELRRTNEFPIPVQTARAGHLLGSVVQALAPHCERLTVVEIGADNHSRLVQKPQAKQKVDNSMGYLVYEIMNAHVEKHANVVVDRSEGMKHLFQIGNYKFLGEHGDSVKSWMGIPFYGLEREKAREASRRMFNDKGFHYIIIGHYHVPLFSQLIMGGSLSGTSEYDHSCGRSSPPCQTAFIVGKRGAFNFVPFTLR
ncbi:MAG: hypothetical protein OK436_06880 [Thaumarchaeota archaeon]|nr:hypothetical protein [Nitrososphaerota archaeon]